MISCVQIENTGFQKKKKKEIQDFIVYLQRVDGGGHTASSFQGLIF